HLQHEEVAVAVGVEVVDHLDDVALRVVDAGQIREAVEREARLRLEEPAHVDDGRRRNRGAGVVGARAREVADRVAEVTPEGGVDGGGVGRGHAAQAFAATAGFRTSQRSCWIFSWSLTSPSVSASGRGGQPGT